MTRITRLAAFTIVTAGGLVALAGCQNAGMQDETDRPVAASVTYDRPYVATRDTQWVSSPGGTTRDLSQGTRAYFSEAPGTADWQQARVEGQGVVYVRPADFGPAR